MHFADPVDLSTGRNRMRGFRNAFEALVNGDARPAMYSSDRYTLEDGERLCREMLQHRKPIADMAANYLLAIGCIAKLRRNGLSCPKDISVAGMNDIPFVGRVDPPLTTVRTPSHAMGQQAADLLFKIMDNKSAPVVRVALKPELVVRRSTAPVAV